MTACPTALLVSLFLSCKTTQELPVTQLARHVDLFHLIIWSQIIRDQTFLPLPWLGPSYKAHYPFQQSCSLICSLVPINLSFPHMVWSLFGSTLQKLSGIVYNIIQTNQICFRVSSFYFPLP
jgi:hypothetical protein